WHTRPGQDDPTYSKPRLQTLKILRSKISPVFLSVHFFFPPHRQTWNLGRHRWVLHVIGQRAPLRQGTKAMEIFSRQFHVVRIQSKQTIGRRVLADPLKSLDPGIAGFCAGPFQVRRGGKGLTLRPEHPRRQWNKQKQPAVNVPPQDLLSNEPPGEQEK